MSATRMPVTGTFFDRGRIRLIEIGRARGGSRQILCFPYAGGGPLAFRGLASELPSGWTVRAVDPPGHVRTKGEPLTDVGAIVDGLMASLPLELLCNSCLLGHSLGGYVALEIAARLERMGRPAAGLIISGSKPPADRDPSRPLGAMNDNQMLEWMGQIGQASAADPESRELFDVFKHAIRADLKAHDSYAPPTEPLETPLLAIGALDDPTCAATRFRQWKAYSTHADIVFVPGGHFFLEDNPRPMARAVTRFAGGAANDNVRVAA